MARANAYQGQEVIEKAKEPLLLYGFESTSIKETELFMEVNTYFRFEFIRGLFNNGLRFYTCKYRYLLNKFRAVSQLGDAIKVSFYECNMFAKGFILRLKCRLSCTRHKLVESNDVEIMSEIFTFANDLNIAVMKQLQKRVNFLRIAKQALSNLFMVRDEQAFGGDIKTSLKQM